MNHIPATPEEHAQALRWAASPANVVPPVVGMRRAERLDDAQWAQRLTANLPRRWQAQMARRWTKMRSKPGDWAQQQDAAARANADLLQTVKSLGTHRIPLDAGDDDLCALAEKLAEACFERATMYSDPVQLRAAMGRIAEANGIDAPTGKKITDAGAIARMTDPIWWRRGVRKLHAKAVEMTAIRMGLVNRARECYVSTQSLKRRIQQNARNAAMLEATIATNEAGQDFTLAELAAKGPANKAIRRAELMTRIAGFERIAIDMGHAGLFFTITCPSYMHKWRTVNKGRDVVENKRYEGVTPREAQKYLAKLWARIRSALARAGVGIYGFRIAEPNHDGTPHWHLLVFHDAAHLDKLKQVVLKHALKEAPNEPGAQLHRVDFKPIDAGRGTAAGYIAKYVAKNIDGFRVESDLFGNPALEASARVETWATTWGIRQFQQIGGPPVGVWRELRRVKELPEGVPDFLADAWRAVNKLQRIEGRENACVAWDRYTKAQGGVFCGRKARIKIATRTAEGLGRYGEPIGERPIGVCTSTLEIYTPEHMAHMGGCAERRVHWIAESTRYVWTISKKRGTAAPWTCVNNCTEDRKNERDDYGRTHQNDGFSPAEFGAVHQKGSSRVGRDAHDEANHGRGRGGSAVERSHRIEQRNRIDEGRQIWQLS